MGLRDEIEWARPGDSSTWPCRPDIQIVVVNTTTLDEELGLWCDVCLLPTRYRGVWVTALDTEPLYVTKLEGCSECGPSS